MFIPLTVTPLAYPCYILIVLIAYLYYNLCAVFKSLHTAIMFVHNAHALLSSSRKILSFVELCTVMF